MKIGNVTDVRHYWSSRKEDTEEYEKITIKNNGSG